MRVEAEVSGDGARTRAASVIRIGSAGWSYKDWEGIVYPANPPKGFHARHSWRSSSTIEIDSSFYRPPSASSVRGWVKRVATKRNFKVTAKLFRGFTHGRNATQNAFRGDWIEAYKKFFGQQ